jgi:hypothetical protein
VHILHDTILRLVIIVPACGSVVRCDTYATSRKVADSRSDEVNFFNLPNLSSPGVYSASNTNEYHKQENIVSGEYSTAGAYG